MVYIIVLNYNGWRNTIECVESVLKSTYKEYRIVIVDNASIDDSLQCMKMWAEGKLNIWLRKDNPLYGKSFPPSNKPLCYCEYNYSNSKFKRIFGVGNEKIVFINSDKNGGYAGGNNVGMKFAINNSNCNYIWLLNNDTVIDKNALFYLKEYSNKEDNISIIGSSLLKYFNPNIIQTLGGSNSISWYKDGNYVMKDKEYLSSIENITINGYINGASMFFNKDVIPLNGYFDENYFMWSEEKDWCQRAIKLGIKMSVVTKSIVWHKEGGTTLDKRKTFKYGREIVNIKRFVITGYYDMRNRIYFARKFYLGLQFFMFCIIKLPYIFIRRLINIVFINRDRFFVRIYLIILGLIDGFMLRMGKTIDPVKFK